jgi:nucleotide sugar dehydrogenase
MVCVLPSEGDAGSDTILRQRDQVTESTRKAVSGMLRSACVVGLGTVGRPTAEFFAGRGIPTYACDINPKALEGTANLQGTSTSLDRLPLADLYIVTVDTSVRSEEPNVANVVKACAAIAARGSPRLVSIESTVPVGTCEQIHADIFRGRQNLVHIPHRWWADDTDRHGVGQPRVVGAIDAASRDLALAFYGSVGIPLVPVRDIRIAELCKAAENTDRYLKIAYAELLKLICDGHGLDFEELRTAMNSKWNVEILEAREGIGGTCLPKDILYVKAAAPEICHLLDGARAVDTMYRKHVGP